MQHHATVRCRSRIDVRERDKYRNDVHGKPLSSDIQRKGFWPHSVDKSLYSSGVPSDFPAAPLSVTWATDSYSAGYKQQGSFLVPVHITKRFGACRSSGEVHKLPNFPGVRMLDGQ